MRMGFNEYDYLLCRSCRMTHIVTSYDPPKSVKPRENQYNHNNVILVGNFDIYFLQWVHLYTYSMENNLQKEDNLSIKDKKLSPKCVHYLEVLLYSVLHTPNAKD